MPNIPINSIVPKMPQTPIMIPKPALTPKTQKLMLLTQQTELQQGLSIIINDANVKITDAEQKITHLPE